VVIASVLVPDLEIIKVRSTVSSMGRSLIHGYVAPESIMPAIV
jgi:hypothetical protein